MTHGFWGVTEDWGWGSGGSSGSSGSSNLSWGFRDNWVFLFIIIVTTHH
jgi:hypothetical protein